MKQLILSLLISMAAFSQPSTHIRQYGSMPYALINQNIESALRTDPVSSIDSASVVWDTTGNGGWKITAFDSNGVVIFSVDSSGFAEIVKLQVSGAAGVTGLTTLNDLTIAGSSTVLMGSNLVSDVTDPVSSQDAATKEYVDGAVEGASFDFFLNNTASDIGGIYYVMDATITGEVESSFSTAGLGIGDDQALTNWSTISTEPGFLELSTGVYSLHFHAEKTAGTRAAVIYAEFYKRASGGAETLLSTSDITSLITSVKASFDVHFTLADDITIASDDRLVIKTYTNVTGGGSNATIVLYAEGNNASRFEVKATSGATDSRYFVKSGLPGGQVAIGGTGVTDGLTFKTTSGVGAVGADMQFLVGNDGATEAVTILNSGNVGIGTATPSSELEIVGNAILSTSNGFFYFDNTENYIHAIAGSFYEIRSTGAATEMTFSSAKNQQFVFDRDDNSTGDVAFKKGSALATKMIITNAGNVGIGESAPETLTEWSGAEPYLTLHDTTEEDTDEGRESKILFKGEQSGGEETTLVSITGSHDGTGNDEWGQLVFGINDGNDGDTPSELFKMQSNGTDAMFGIGLVGNLSFSLDIDAAGETTVRLKGDGDGTNFNEIRMQSDEATDKRWHFQHRQTSPINEFRLAYYDGSSLYPKINILPGTATDILNIDDSGMEVGGKVGVSDSLSVGSSGVWIRDKFFTTNYDSIGEVYWNPGLARIDTVWNFQ